MSKLFTIFATGALISLPLLSACSDQQDSTMAQQPSAEQAQERGTSAETAAKDQSGEMTEEDSVLAREEKADYDRRYPAKEAEDTARISAGSDYKDKYGELGSESEAEAAEGEKLAQSDAARSLPGFDELDVNDDGLLDAEESREYEVLAATFAQYDMNDDGELDKKEYAELKDRASASTR